MIAGSDVRILKIAPDVRAVLIEDHEKLRKAIFVHLSRLKEQIEGRD